MTSFVLALSSSFTVTTRIPSWCPHSSIGFCEAIVAHRKTCISAGRSCSMSANAFIDIGANLLDECFQGRYNGGSQKHEPDLDGVLERATAAGVEKVAFSCLERHSAVVRLSHYDRSTLLQQIIKHHVVVAVRRDM